MGRRFRYCPSPAGLRRYQAPAGFWMALARAIQFTGKPNLQLREHAARR
jgi:hypothetical protein